MLLVGSGSGAHDPLRPLGAIVSTSGTSSGTGPALATHEDWQPVKSVDDIPLNVASTNGIPIV